MGAEQTANPLIQLVPFAVIFLIFWVLVIRPQQQKEKERKNLVDNLIKNDDVITTSGIHGRVVTVKEKTVVIRVDDNTKIEFDKDAIVTVAKSKSDESKTN